MIVIEADQNSKNLEIKLHVTRFCLFCTEIALKVAHPRGILNLVYIYIS